MPKRRATEGEENRGGRAKESERSGREAAERERDLERERERERRQKEREEREKEWVKKAGGDATRNRRVFGVLLGTLQRFRKDQSAVADKVPVHPIWNCFALFALFIHPPKHALR